MFSKSLFVLKRVFVCFFTIASKKNINSKSKLMAVEGIKKSKTLSVKIDLCSISPKFR